MRRPASGVTKDAVFLNIPYDQRFRSLCLAYIAGLVYLGYVPRVIAEQPSAERRLDKILAEIQGCRYSIHDLSRIGVDRKPPFPTPRFNMPFELGLAVAWQDSNPTKHSWYVFEAKAHRVQKSLSDLNGTDPQIHGGKVSGVIRELSNILPNIFPGSKNQHVVPKMMNIFNIISRRSARILAEAGTKNLFEAQVFLALCYEARVAAEIELLK